MDCHSCICLGLRDMPGLDRLLQREAPDEDPQQAGKKRHGAKVATQSLLVTHQRTLLKGANMQHFQVDSIQCDPSGDEGLLMGGWNSDSDMSSDTDSQHSNE